MSERAALRRGLIVLLVAGWLITAAASAARADDCGTPSDCEETGGFIGITSVVGGVAAVAAAAAAAVTATGSGAAEAGAESESDGEKELAIIQVTTDRVDVDVDAPGRFQVQAWLATASRGTVQAPQIPLSIRVPPTPGLSVAPLQGQGRLDVEVSVDDTAEPGEVRIVVTGTYKGRATEQPVTIAIGGGYVLEIY